MKQYVYFYHAVCSGSQGERIARHGVVNVPERIDTERRYLKFCKAVGTIFYNEASKNKWNVKDVEITTLQFLHEIDA